MREPAVLLEKFKKVKVLVVGDVMLDRYLWGSVSRISPEAPVPVVKLEKTTSTAGGAANVAANIAGLGATAILIGLIGFDSGGSKLKENLEKSNVSSLYLVETANRPTITKTRVIAQHQQVARIDEELTGCLSAQEENDLYLKVTEVLAQADLVILSDYGKSVLSESLLKKIITDCHSAQKKVLVDPKGNNFAKYNGATILTPNKSEAVAVSGVESLALNAIGQHLLNTHKISKLLITLGEEGMMLFERDKNPQHFPTQSRKVYDVTGAGDTVIATLAVSLGAGEPLLDAIKLANFCAGIVVEKLGTTAICTADLVSEWKIEESKAQ